MDKQKEISLREWIDEIGVDEMRKLFGIKESTVYHWRRGHCLPRSEQMYSIVKYSRGRVSYETMINTFVKKQEK